MIYVKVAKVLHPYAEAGTGQAGWDFTVAFPRKLITSSSTGSKPFIQALLMALPVALPLLNRSSSSERMGGNQRVYSAPFCAVLAVADTQMGLL